ncbi:unnamed protein product [Dracunculus medinensis]|uniref:Ovule protein n=1 Tax=Dracunculus medinensis TaxID=318479 RepID=A0A0N4UHJ0_DRAME|nr:unnamed protein product [Dracunculus medinensis]
MENDLFVFEEHELFVNNTCFQHQRKHLDMWNSPDNIPIRLIIHWSVTAGRALDSRSYRGAETGNHHESDHDTVQDSYLTKLTKS